MTAEEAERRWTTSVLYELRTIPTWVPSPYRRVEPGRESRSTGPIIVDLNPDGFRRRYGSFLQDINLMILDGKHRRNRQVIDHGDSSIEAFVGREAIPELERWVAAHGEPRARFAEALDAFHDEPDSGWRPLISAGRAVGLDDRQLRKLWEANRGGWRFSPPLNRFLPAED